MTIAILVSVLAGASYTFSIGLHAVLNNRIKTTAAALAKDLMEEVLSKTPRWTCITALPLTADAGETRCSIATPGCLPYDEMDDYNGYAETGPNPQAWDGQQLAMYQGYRRSVTVEFVTPAPALAATGNVLPAGVTDLKHVQVVTRYSAANDFAHPEFTYTLDQIVARPVKKAVLVGNNTGVTGPSCVPDPFAGTTRSTPCPSGQNGTITETYLSTCPGPVSGWKTTDTTRCSPARCTPPKAPLEKRNIQSCAPQSGSTYEENQAYCDGSTLVDKWVLVNACGCEPKTESRPPACQAGQTPMINETWVATCPGPVWSKSKSGLCSGLIDPLLVNPFTILLNSSVGNYYAQSLLDHQVPMQGSTTLSAGVLAAFAWSCDAAHISCTEVIYVNTNPGAADGYSDIALAGLLNHEAMHADYLFNSQKWIDQTVSDHGVPAGDVHISSPPYDSYDQEYHAFENTALLWKELKGAEKNEQLDITEAYYDLGESYLKDAIRTSYAGMGLGEY